jgi:hypothetical protein
VLTERPDGRSPTDRALRCPAVRSYHLPAVDRQSNRSQRSRSVPRNAPPSAATEKPGSATGSIEQSGLHRCDVKEPI